MIIHTKTLDGGTNNAHTVDMLFGYAQEVLSARDEQWIFTPTVESKNGSLIFRDSNGQEHGWQFTEMGTNATSNLVSNGISSPGGRTDITSAAFGLFTGAVWENEDGSVGIGYQNASGKIVTWYLLIKFNGKYLEKELYGVAEPTFSSSHAPIMVHGTVDIGSVNHCAHDAIGSGVYLHPLYDPVSGLVSSDVFGVQSMDTKTHAIDGSVVKQGGVSYMSILGGEYNGVSQMIAKNTLFVRM